MHGLVASVKVKDKDKHDTDSGSGSGSIPSVKPATTSAAIQHKEDKKDKNPKETKEELPDLEDFDEDNVMEHMVCEHEYTIDLCIIGRNWTPAL